MTEIIRGQNNSKRILKMLQKTQTSEFNEKKKLKLKT